jgi:hypothetical protein
MPPEHDVSHRDLALFPAAWYLLTAVPAMPPEVLHREN